MDYLFNEETQHISQSVSFLILTISIIDWLVDNAFIMQCAIFFLVLKVSLLLLDVKSVPSQKGVEQQLIKIKYLYLERGRKVGT